MEIRIVSGKKYAFGRVCMFLNCTARSSVAKATCQVATRHLGAATESTYVPCPANLFAPATASPPVFVLVSDGRHIFLVALLMLSGFQVCYSLAIFIALFTQIASFSLYSESCESKILISIVHVEVRMTDYLESRLVIV